jgi:hypothetical protein
MLIKADLSLMREAERGTVDDLFVLILSLAEGSTIVRRRRASAWRVAERSDPGA